VGDTYELAEPDPTPEPSGRPTPRPPNAGPDPRTLRPHSHVSSKQTRCGACGYLLHGMPKSGRCPECGRPVMYSIERTGRIEASSIGHVRQLCIGSTLICAVIILMILEILLGILWMFGTEPDVWTYVGPVVGFVKAAGFLVGWWLLSSPDPAISIEEKPWSARRLLRVFMVIGVTLAGFTLIGAFVSVPILAGAGYALATAFVTAAQLFCSMSYMRVLADQLGDERISERALLVMWLAPTGLLLGVFGPLVLPCVFGLIAFVMLFVALVLYGMIMFWARSDIAHAYAYMKRRGA
jgi:hypothetical protein